MQTVSETRRGQATAPDGTRLWTEITGPRTGEPLLFLHEFAGDHASWGPQLKALANRYRCITYNARGYPPSDVPRHIDAYSQDHAVTDALAVLDWAGVPNAHIVGLSMGGFTALHLALDHVWRCRSVTLAGVGYGSADGDGDRFAKEANAAADAFERDAAVAAGRYALGPTRVQFRTKDLPGWQQFAERLATHDPVGSALTLRGVQARRPSVRDLADRLGDISVPVLLLVGDEDDGCLEPALVLKRRIRTSALAVAPFSGHTLNLEEPAWFNARLEKIFAGASLGRWPVRDPASQGRGLVGMDTPPIPEPDASGPAAPAERHDLSSGQSI